MCSGCDVFDLVEPVQGELPRRTEPSFVCVLVVISLPPFVIVFSLTLSLSGTGKAWTQEYEDALEDAQQVSQGQSNKHVLQVG